MEKKHYCFVCNKKAFYFCGNGCKTTYCGEACARKVYINHKAVCSLLIEGIETKKRERTFASLEFYKEFSQGNIVYGTDENELCIPNEYGTIEEEIGEGISSMVFTLSEEGLVLKAIPLNTFIPDGPTCDIDEGIEISEKKFLEEVENAKVASNVGVGPEILYSTICKGWKKIDFSKKPASN